MKLGPLLALVAATFLVAAVGSAGDPAARRRPLIQPFPLADVQLATGSEFAANHEQNNHYLLLLDPDNLLWCFRDNAGLDAPGEAYGGWEWVDVEIRGQFIGHYMSALAFAAQSTGRPEFYDRGKLVVNELRKVQAAIGTGYLSAFPVSHFDRLEALQGVWAPYYVIHKIMAGFLDQHQLAGAEGALDAVQWMADYFCGRVRRVLEANGTDVWHQILEVEFGGMNEVLYNLHSITGNASHAECARRFDKPAFLQPLLDGRDPMPGLHANTHLAQVQGFAARYEHLGDPQGLLAVRNFFNLMLQHHTFSTGGSNWYEHWGEEDRLGDALQDAGASQMTEESCTQYNILKVARYLFRFTGEAALADFYERAILNDVIGVQKMPHAHQLGGAAHAHAHGLGHPHSHVHNDKSSSGGHDAWPSAGGGREGTTAAASQRRRLQRSYGRRFTPADLPQEAFAGLPANQAAAASEAVGAAQHGGGADWRQQLARMQPRPEQAGEYGDAPRPGGPGQFIYYLPLGTGMDKVSKGGWTHGFGTPFNSFWCCYGTAVESFAKLADSIYFKTMPEEPPSASSDGAAAGSGATVGPPPELLPQLFVNQLVSSSVRWRELRVVVHQQADIYGPETAAVSRLTLEIYPPDAHEGSGGAAEAEQRRFALNWRIPGWAKASGVQLRVNGKNVTGCAEGAAAAQAQGRGQPGQRGHARFCTLGNTWTNGDVVEAFMPMGITTEGLADSRPELRSWRAVMMGPLLMAGLTHDTNELDADPDSIQDAVSLPNATALVSLALPAAGPAGSATPDSRGEPPLLRHCAGGELTIGARCPGGGGASPLDATFHLAAPLAGEAVERDDTPDDDDGSLLAAARQLLVQPVQGAASREDGVLRPTSSAGGAPEWRSQAGLRLASFEAASAPGHFLTADAATGRLVLRQARSEPPAAQTFRLHPLPRGGDGDAPDAADAEPSFELEPLSRPGSRVQLAAGSPEASAGTAVRLRLAPPAAPAYPRGARVLHGRNRNYLLVPLGQIMDESYTAYFKFASK